MAGNPETPEPNNGDQEPDSPQPAPPLPGETDDAIRARHRREQDEGFLEERDRPVSPEEDKRNREMLDRLRRGDYSTPDEDQPEQ